jgi:hypothetical protein
MRRAIGAALGLAFAALTALPAFALRFSQTDFNWFAKPPRTGTSGEFTTALDDSLHLSVRLRLDADGDSFFLTESGRGRAGTNAWIGGAGLFLFPFAGASGIGTAALPATLIREKAPTGSMLTTNNGSPGFSSFHILIPKANTDAWSFTYEITPSTGLVGNYLMFAVVDDIFGPIVNGVGGESNVIPASPGQQDFHFSITDQPSHYRPPGIPEPSSALLFAAGTLLVIRVLGRPIEA